MNIALRADVCATQTASGYVLLDERTGRYWQLNGSGGLIAQALLDGGTVQGAVAALQSAYDVEVATAEADVLALVDHLQAAKLIVTTQDQR